MNGEINWGPEIRVDGARPEWLGDGVKIIARVGGTWNDPMYAIVAGHHSAFSWSHCIDAIRLPADHPHYATSKPHQAQSPSEVGPEVVERCIDLCEAVIAQKPFVRHSDGPGIIYEARDLLPLLKALLPEPVDADLVEARRIAVEQLTAPGQSDTFLGLIADGTNDHYSEVRIALAAIKRGRSLEKEAGR